MYEEIDNVVLCVLHMGFNGFFLFDAEVSFAIIKRFDHFPNSVDWLNDVFELVIVRPFIIYRCDIRISHSGSTYVSIS